MALQVTDWIGREETAQGRVEEIQAAMLAATLSDAGATAPRHGDELPALWHWVAFLPTVANWPKMVTPSWAVFFRRWLCPAGCGPLVSWSSSNRCALANA